MCSTADYEIPRSRSLGFRREKLVIDNRMSEQLALKQPFGAEIADRAPGHVHATRTKARPAGFEPATCGLEVHG